MGTTNFITELGFCFMPNISAVSGIYKTRFSEIDYAL
jgi:hypothetical protein